MGWPYRPREQSLIAVFGKWGEKGQQDQEKDRQAMSTLFTTRDRMRINKEKLDELVEAMAGPDRGAEGAGQTFLAWMYRDGANFKAEGAVVLEGAPEPALLQRLALALSYEEGEPDFITAEVGLGEHVSAEHWDDSIDHPFSTILEVRGFDPERDALRVTVHGETRSFADFVAAVETAKMDPDWLPEGYGEDLELETP